MFIKALIAFLALPGAVAFAIPLFWVYRSADTHINQPIGLVLMALGIAGVLWRVQVFYVSGKGTLAPWAPPIRLVRTGLYRISRNPMYLAVILLLLGWSLSFSSTALVIYTLTVALIFHLRVVYGEEPWLERTHGSEWVDYVSRVRRWV